MNHDILKVRVEEACKKIADSGVEGVDDKEVVLACFGMMMFNGLEHLSKDLKDLKMTLNRTAWAISSLVISTLIAIVLALLI